MNANETDTILTNTPGYSGTVDDASHATNIYTDNSDGTVTDISSSLMWQQASSSKEMAWEQALAYCEKLASSQ